MQSVATSLNLLGGVGLGDGGGRTFSVFTRQNVPHGRVKNS